MNRSRTATWVKLMAGTAVLSLTLAACGSDDDTPEAEDPTSEPTSETPESDATETFTERQCGGGTTSADTFKVGGILPLTGNLAFLGPPEIAGVGLAVSDINAAGGVNGADAATRSRTPATPPTCRSRPPRPGSWSRPSRRSSSVPRRPASR